MILCIIKPEQDEVLRNEQPGQTKMHSPPTNNATYYFDDLTV